MTILKLKGVINRIPANHFCSNVVGKNKYSKTVLLPQTKFPLRLEKQQKLLERDRLVNEANTQIYAWQQANRSDPEFILHDGPPYANGEPHMGHAVNKILKDTILRAEMLQGKKIQFIPGWDCHGLPIELKALAKTKQKPLSPMEIRGKARNFAKETIEKQKAAFKSWGVMGDWQNAYTTYSTNYIKNQLCQFYKLYEKNLIYRAFKPVYWSPSSRTALAEAELEYNAQHVSKAATLRMKVLKLPEFFKQFDNLFVLIWTTTPWTLPSNQAVCYNNNLSYSIIQEDGVSEVYLIATDLVEAHSKLLNKKFNIVDTFSGTKLEGMTYTHPIFSNELPLLHSDHASAIKGTGLVHTAPAHGPEDFVVALQNDIKIISLVNDEGTYTTEASSTLEGLPVLTKGTDKVLSILSNDIVHLADYVHSYPYDWRTKKPVILKASKQWFINVEAIKDRAAELLEDVEIIPKSNSEIYRKNLLDQLKKRPFWCISRQRTWGVPIPVFYERETNRPLINKTLIQHLCYLLETHGPDYWWELPLQNLIPPKVLEELKLKLDDVIKGEDILDIWFDSGISWSSVLSGSQVADMYLEGIDQFTGWFQSSLITSVALRDKAPYKKIYVHGFVLDEKGMKMSKSLGNVIHPHEIIYGSNKEKGYGIDTLRWWVTCHANHDSVSSITKNVLKASSDEVQKIRAVLRFALGSLHDYNIQDFEYKSLGLVDKYLLHMLYEFKLQADEYLKHYQFNKLCKLMLNFVTNEVSAIYYTAIKDRLYCDEMDSLNRQAVQFVLHNLFFTLTETISPIVPHLTEELYSHLPQMSSPFLFQKEFCDLPPEWSNNVIKEVFSKILDIRRDINKLQDSNTLDLELNLSLSKEFHDTLCDAMESTEELIDIFQVSSVKLNKQENQNHPYAITFEKSKLVNCFRCRKVAALPNYELCKRCQFIVNSLENKEATSN